MTPNVTIFTDGSCRGNPGPGGWGALLMFGESEKEIWGGEPATTNNRMELTAAIEALLALKRPCRVELHTDKPVRPQRHHPWLSLWKARGWRTMSSAGETIPAARRPARGRKRLFRDILPPFFPCRAARTLGNPPRRVPMRSCDSSVKFRYKNQ